MMELLPFNGTTCGPHGCKQDRAAASPIEQSQCCPVCSPWGTHNELCLTGWHVMSSTRAVLGYDDLVVRSGYVPPSPFSHHGPGSSPATGKKCCATYSDSPCLSTVAVSLSPVGRVAPLGATRLEWCPHSTPFPPAGCCPVGFKCCAMRSLSSCPSSPSFRECEGCGPSRSL